MNREKYAVETSAAVKEVINQKDYARLDQILKRERAKALLHMNRLDIETGSTILHDAARRNDRKLVELLLAHGADPIRRDRKSKLPYEVTKDPEIRNMLRATQPAKATSTSAVPGERISQKGYLKKTEVERAYVYRAAQPKGQVIGAMVKDFVNRVFNGAAEPLLVHLVEEHNLSREDLEEIARLRRKS